jgi:hypothetical protein
MLDARAESEEIDRELAGDMLRHAGVRLTDVLVLVGGNAGLLVGLYRCGFTHVCLAVAPSPCMAQTADVLWLPHAGEPSAGGRLPGLLQVLREGGTLVLHGLAPASRRRLDALRRQLRAEGFAAVEQAVESGRFCLVARSLARNRSLARHAPAGEPPLPREPASTRTPRPRFHEPPNHARP